MGGWVFSGVPQCSVDTPPPPLPLHHWPRANVRIDNSSGMGVHRLRRRRFCHLNVGSGNLSVTNQSVCLAAYLLVIALRPDVRIPY